jgi:two-component system NarL family response regulator
MAELCERTQPDVAIIDLHLPQIDAAELIPLLARLVPGTRVLLWSGEAHPRATRAALDLGAHGQLPKQATERQIARAIVELARPNAAPCVTRRRTRAALRRPQATVAR